MTIQAGSIGQVLAIIVLVLAIVLFVLLALARLL